MQCLLLLAVFAILAVASAWAAPYPTGVIVAGPSGVITSAAHPGLPGLWGLGLGGLVLG